MALVRFQQVGIGFGGPLVLEEANLALQPNERVCLVGRNGAGKSTLLKLLGNQLQPDGGQILRRAGLRWATLSQEIPKSLTGRVFDIVAAGLGETGQLIASYQHISQQLATNTSDTLLRELDQVQRALDAADGWTIQQRVEQTLTRMQLEPDVSFSALSGGLKRRVLLAQALVTEPDLLLLDEPTNHLDIENITWLESFLLRFQGTLVFVTHDRTFLRNLATRIIEVDRGHLHDWACDYDTFLQRKEAKLEIEARQNALFDKKLAEEEVWIRKGIKARRTRNEGRVRALEKMREERQQRRERLGTATIRTQDTERSGRLVIEAKQVSFQYPGTDAPTLRPFDTLIMRGDKVGLIGPNGSGKTTLLRLLLGDLSSPTGTIRHGTNLQIAYFDQQRAQLDGEKTVWENLGLDGDTIQFNGRARHVISYLQDFLFTPERARTAVKVLSGGERNRLLLARLFTQPANLLVLDEPTNDLDVETLELLESLLVAFEGTVLLVSHDRTFLNNVVTSSLVLEGEGRVKEYIGGYDDWLRQRPAPKPEPVASPKPKAKERPQRTRPRKLSYKEKQELAHLPEQIETLETEQSEIYATLADPTFYQTKGDQTTKLQARLDAIASELEVAYERWETLEQLAESL